jgi:hypothetical protein
MSAWEDSPVVEYIHEELLKDGFDPVELPPEDPHYEDYVSHVAEGWCPSDTTDGPSRLRPISDIRTRERWGRCDHGVRWRLRFANDRTREE